VVDKWVVTQCQRRIDRTPEDERYHFPQQICGNPVMVIDREDVLETALCGPCLYVYGASMPEIHSHGNFIHAHKSFTLWHNKKHCAGFSACQGDLNP
jgi:hypothetical protein